MFLFAGLLFSSQQLLSAYQVQLGSGAGYGGGSSSVPAAEELQGPHPVGTHGILYNTNPKARGRTVPIKREPSDDRRVSFPPAQFPSSKTPCEIKTQATLPEQPFVQVECRPTFSPKVILVPSSTLSFHVCPGSHL